MVEKKAVGKIAHYYNKIGVAVVDVTGEIKVGDTLSIEGSSTNVKQKVTTMQIEHKAIQAAKKGQSVGMKVADRVREGDVVYKVLAA